MSTSEGLSAVDAGLALLPQGLVTGISIVIGDRLSKKQEIRRTVVIGMALLTAGTAALMLIDVRTPVWLTAAILSARGLALGLTIQPLLVGTIGSLRGREIPDGNTLFNVFQRLGGSLGVSMLATFLSLREQYYIAQVLSRLGMSGGNVTNSLGQAVSGSSLSSIPPAIASQTATASANGFHDTVLLVVGISFVGLLLAVFLRDTSNTAEEKEATSDGSR